MGIEKFEIPNRFTNAVQFTAEIEVTPETTTRIKLGLAVRWASKNDVDLSDANLRFAYLRGADVSGANLRGADLSGSDLIGADLSDAYLRGADLSGADVSGAHLNRANLSGAYLSGANLRGANLRGADLSGADLSDADLRGALLNDADLRSIKADYFMTLLHTQSEVPYLIAALKEGHVDGSQYEGECACLIGTLAKGSDKKYSEVFTDSSSRNPAEQWFLIIRKGDKAGDVSGGGFAAQKALEWAEEFLALMGKE